MKDTEETHRRKAEEYRSSMIGGFFKSVSKPERIRKGMALRQPSQIAREKTALEVINYKTGRQGFPMDVVAFEKEVKRQHPKTKEEFMNEMREMSLSDIKPDKYVFEYLNELRREHGLEGGDFSETTKKWFNEHPPILAYVQGWHDHKHHVKVKAGRKGGLKGKGGRPCKYKTEEERKEAHKLRMRATAKKAKGG